jgi:hypothetical protein
MVAVMDRLVAGARASRDGEFNTLDAVDRQTRAASVALAARIESIIAANRADPQTPGAAEGAPERDARFDPEDEWELAGPSTPTAARAVGGGGRSDADQDGPDAENEDYPPTWLR